MKAKTITLFFALSIALLSACKPTENDDKATPFPHTMPGINTMQPDMSSFDANAQTSTALAKRAGSLNHTTAAVYVGFWSLVVAAHMVIPGVVYGAALSEDPVLSKEGYLWEKKVLNNDVSLLATIQGTAIQWKMTVNGPKFSNFVWNTGESNLTGTSGSWTFFQENSTDTALFIPWTRESSGVAGNVKITSKVAESMGNYLDWTVSGTSRTFIGHDEVLKKTATIEWDAEGRDGNFVLDSAGQKSPRKCWDYEESSKTFSDVDCL